MILALYIDGSLVEEMRLDLSHLPTIELRERVVKEYAYFLKDQFSDQIRRAQYWEIILRVKSRLRDKKRFQSLKIFYELAI